MRSDECSSRIFSGFETSKKATTEEFLPLSDGTASTSPITWHPPAWFRASRPPVLGWKPKLGHEFLLPGTTIHYEDPAGFFALVAVREQEVLPKACQALDVRVAIAVGVHGPRILRIGALRRQRIDGVSHVTYHLILRGDDLRRPADGFGRERLLEVLRLELNDDTRLGRERLERRLHHRQHVRVRRATQDSQRYLEEEVRPLEPATGLFVAAGQFVERILVRECTAEVIREADVDHTVH